jgi:RNA polymerase-binding protein DksA
MSTTHGSTHARHDESPSSPAQLAALRDILDASRQAVLQRAAAFVDESSRIDWTSATHGQGETEHTSVDIERRVSRVLEDQARELLVDIDDALARIDDGTYGRCSGCGAAIPVERLFAVPTARFCVTCQAQRDAG